MKSNTRRASIYYSILFGIAVLVLGLIGIAIAGLTQTNSAEGGQQSQLEPLREFEIGDVARFVVGGGDVHQGPIIDYRLDENNQWVYDVEFAATNGGESSIWQDLEEYRILL